MKLGFLCVSYMPVKGDEAEARVVHGALVRFMERSDPRIVGENARNLPKVLSVIADIIGTPHLTEEYTARAVQVIKQIQTTYPADLLAAATASLSDEQKQKLASASNS
eukprot:Plantae.Rhodophyta-Palmaria_palmata.ctg1700.p2 GENE.Plantae.Rhodophyta-Palmaria_palmata.ctg1700~~Plantae.Rhodophyta-Palmaria_palmata.ctg1700.p2  ORF type:complete len:108 (+),score=23.01 Plantae.Rhodophyta-Palmaria_palmata.ctg1700:28-351(+)